MRVAIIKNLTVENIAQFDDDYTPSEGQKEAYEHTQIGEPVKSDGELMDTKWPSVYHIIDNGVWVVNPEFEDDYNLDELIGFRLQRDQALELYVDHFQKPLLFETLTEAQKQELRDYRTALLDSTDNQILPNVPQWIEEGIK